jgi:hypothetical protein
VGGEVSVLGANYAHTTTAASQLLFGYKKYTPTAKTPPKKIRNYNSLLDYACIVVFCFFFLFSDYIPLFDKFPLVRDSKYPPPDSNEKKGEFVSCINNIFIISQLAATIYYFRCLAGVMAQSIRSINYRKLTRPNWRTFKFPAAGLKLKNQINLKILN